MQILLIHESTIPTLGYGGIERVVFWLAREYQKLGHRVTVMCRPGSQVAHVLPGVKFLPHPGNTREMLETLPAADIVHFHETPLYAPERPYMVTIHGNGRAGEKYLTNTVFVSKSHAQNHGAQHFVYNGIPLEEFPLEKEKEDYMVFMAKLNWAVKNARTAINLACDTRMPIKLAGGDLYKSPRSWGSWLARLPIKLPWVPHGVGQVGGDEKLQLLRKASLLFYLVNWPEPFALAPHEALATGTPVLASPNGALSEYIVHGKNGYLAESYRDAREIIERHRQLSAERRVQMALDCRSSAMSARKMALNYLTLYEQLQTQRHLVAPEVAARYAFAPKPIVRIVR